MNNFSKMLIEWYKLNKRTLPWKKSFDVYQIWLSEIILQQTRIEQGTPYYLKFIDKYPTIVDFANEDIGNILKLWEGLGYYSRARNMHHTAKHIRDTYNGIFPNNYEAIRKLKGIGDYTAAAIASFGYQLPYAVVDGNVYRVLSRIFGIDVPIDTTAGKKYFQHKAQELLNKKNPAEYNQAIMDFGSLVCSPKNPQCTSCPFSSNCIAYQQDKISTLPVKSKKLIKKKRFFHYFVFNNQQEIILHHRNNQDIWKLLYDFPCIETDSEKILDNDLKKYKIKKLPNPIQLNQVLTHQNIDAYFYDMDYLPKQIPDACIVVKVKDIQRHTFPKIIKNYLKCKNL
jgi:A/G-specific adenine glycosylase